VRVRTPSKPALALVAASLLNLAVVYVVVSGRPGFFELLFVWAGILSALEAWGAGRLLESRASFVPTLAVVLGVLQPLVFVAARAGDAAVALSAAVAVASVLPSWAAKAGFAWRP